MTEVKPFHHFEPTKLERINAVQVWREWVLKGGVDAVKPNPFQLDNLNDTAIRDAFLFWVAGGSLPAIKGVEDEAIEMYAFFGPPPTDHDKTCEALDKVIETLDSTEETMDTGIVIVLATIMVFLKQRHFGMADHLLRRIAKLAIMAASKGKAVAHLQPMQTLAILIELLKVLNDDTAANAVDTFLGLREGEDGDDFEIV